MQALNKIFINFNFLKFLFVLEPVLPPAPPTFKLFYMSLRRAGASGLWGGLAGTRGEIWEELRVPHLWTETGMASGGGLPLA